MLRVLEDSRLGYQLEELAHRPVLDELASERLARHDAVVDASPFAAGEDVAGLTQVAEDQGDAALAEMEPLGHVPDA